MGVWPALVTITVVFPGTFVDCDVAWTEGPGEPVWLAVRLADVVWVGRLRDVLSVWMGICVGGEGVSCDWEVSDVLAGGGEVVWCAAIDEWADVDGLAWSVSVIFTLVDCVAFVLLLSYLETEKEKHEENDKQTDENKIAFCDHYRPIMSTVGIVINIVQNCPILTIKQS